MDSNIAIAAATSFAVTLAAKGVEGPAKTLDLLWKSTFGRWNPLLEKYIAENARKYATSIENKISHIPPEYINQKPDISVLGPALEASKYYVTENEIREMFANLIAADFDMRKKIKFITHLLIL